MEIDNFQTKIMKLYDDFCAGVLTESDYKLIKARYESDNETRKTRMSALSIRAARMEADFVDKNVAVVEFDMFAGESRLTREMLTALADRIEVDGQRNVHIMFKYRDEYEDLMTCIAESGGADNA
jgi:FtsZ-interacting cell division protein YlmF